MSKKMILLKSSDGESFEVDKAVGLQWQPIAHLIEDDCANSIIPISNVTGKILAKVIEYCKKHAVVEGGDDSSPVEDLKKWDAEFMQTDQSTIFDLIMAANYLDIPSLLDLACQTIADMITACKDPKDICAKFGIESDFTPEEEEALLNENRWGFEWLVNLNHN